MSKEGKIEKRTLAEHISVEPSQAGLAGKYRPLVTCVHELTTNSLDAGDEEGILPDIKINMNKVGENTFEIIHKDNCGGLTPEEAKLAFGSYLASSKFETAATRGQQGIGVSSLFTHAYRTTMDTPEVWTSKVGNDEETHLTINPLAVEKEDRVKSEVKEGVSESEGWTKVRFRIGPPTEGGEEGELRFLSKEKSKRGSKNTIYAYLRYIHMANPHARIEFKPPTDDEDVSDKTFERIVDESPEPPEPIKPHPHGVLPYDIKVMIEKELVKNPDRGNEKLYEYIREEFARVGSTKIKQIKEKAEEKYGSSIDYKKLASSNISEIKEKAEDNSDFNYEKMLKIEKDRKDRQTLKDWLKKQKESDNKKENRSLNLNMKLENFISRSDSIVNENLKQLLDVFNSVDFYKPKKKGLSTIKEENFVKSIKKYYEDVDFYHYSSSKPFIHSSNPSQVEVIVAKGDKTGKENNPEIVRLANKVPLLYEKGADAIHRAIAPTAKDRRKFWSYYNIDVNETCTILVNYVSTRVPFTGMSKAAISPEEDIIKQIKSTTADCFRKFKTHLRKKKRKRKRRERAEKIKKYVKAVDNEDILKSLTGRNKKPKYNNIYERIEEQESKDKINYNSLVLENSISAIKDIVEGEDDIDFKKMLKIEKDNKGRKSLLNWLEEKIEEKRKDIDYDELVKKSVSDIKEKVDDLPVDLKKLFEMEKNNKDRKTLKKWIVIKDSSIIDYSELVKDSVGNVKSKVEDYNLDCRKVFEAEKENKNRKTLKKWLIRKGKLVDYNKLVNNTISDIKSRVKSEDLNIEKVLEAEKNGKDRKTLKKWLRNKNEG